jgi:hypothetical protein
MGRDFDASLGLVPGAYVRHPTESDWGLGQVQSVIGERVTVSFENRGKVTIIADRVALKVVDPSTEENE